MNQAQSSTVAVAGKASVCVQRGEVVDMAGINVDGWRKVCAVDEIPRLGARVVKSAAGNIAVFRNAEDEVFALADKCPHKGGPLSQGIVHGRKVTCPLHGWNIRLEDGVAVAPDIGCARKFETKVENGAVLLKIQPSASNQP